MSVYIYLYSNTSITKHLDDRTNCLDNRTLCSVIEVKSNYIDNKTNGLVGYRVCLDHQTFDYRGSIVFSFFYKIWFSLNFVSVCSQNCVKILNNRLLMFIFFCHRFLLFEKVGWWWFDAIFSFLWWWWNFQISNFHLFFCKLVYIYQDTYS